MAIDNNTVALAAAIFTFVASMIGSLIAWNKANKDNKTVLRVDIFKLNETLSGELDKLRKRIDALEEENTKSAKNVRELETLIEKIRAALYMFLDADLDELLRKYHERITSKPKSGD